MIRAWEIDKNNRYPEQALSVDSQETNERREELTENGKGRYSYRATLAAAQKVNWRIEDIIGGDKRLDFSKPFMPESLARVEPLDFLRANEKRTLNQIRGAAYLGIFGLVEEFILPFVLDHARPQLQPDDYRVRALLQFAGEEAKHIHLFKRFREEFRARLRPRLRCDRPARSHRPSRAGA